MHYHVQNLGSRTGLQLPPNSEGDRITHRGPTPRFGHGSDRARTQFDTSHILSNVEISHLKLSTFLYLFRAILALRAHRAET